MLVAGLSGGPELVHENRFGLSPYSNHDAACVLIEDGEVLFACEEERLNRIKHTNKFPNRALRSCLDARGIAISDLDLIAFYTCEPQVDGAAKSIFLADATAAVLHSSTSLLRHWIQREFSGELPDSKFRFVHHQQAHAMSAYALSGFDKALVISLDGLGDGLAGMIMVGEGGQLEPIGNIAADKSLGLFYADFMPFLGYSVFDEYKVMGLAPYGDPTKYRHTFQQLYQLHPNGEYQIDRGKLAEFFNIAPPRRKGEPFSQVHKDLAAGLQASLEELAFHVIGHHCQSTGLKNFCFAGGVAHNCTLNGKLLNSGMFERMFVQPAAHDAGGALGSALYAYRSARPRELRPAALQHVYWGPELGSEREIALELSRWRDFLSWQSVGEEVCERAAELLAADEVIGWVQGRSEFGPRALGNRSILADPRPAENKDRINRMVKKREGYRPFAPSVLEEYVEDYFVVPSDNPTLPFMIFVVDVQPDKRRVLGATTHVDGTARAHTVSRTTNPTYWRLIDAFRELTSVPILLNTSFNNHAEPIVDSVEDAIVCFLTTELDALVVGQHLVRKKPSDLTLQLSLKPSLPAYIRLVQSQRCEADGRHIVLASLENTYDTRFQYVVSERLFALLSRADGKTTLRSILSETYGGEGEAETRAMVDELLELWSQRVLVLRP